MTTSARNLKKTKLWRYLFLINQDYSERCISFVNGVSPILETISEIFPFYTRHDASHSLSIINKYTKILKPECFKKNNRWSLNEIEAYLLICSAYSHDLGMAIFPGEEQKLLSNLMIDKTSEWQANNILHEYLRDNHSSRGIAYLRSNRENLAIPPNLLDLLDKMMRAHNQSTEDIRVLGNSKFSAANEQLPLGQLACILCVADALEFSDTRVKEGVISRLREILNDNSEDTTLLSYQENMKNVCIGSNIAISKNGEIIVTGSFESADILNLAHKTFDDIEFWLQDYLNIDGSFDNPRLSIRNHVIYRNLKYLPGEFERLGIRLKKENIIKLITSNAIWQGNKAGVIKELLQNSVEACRYRKYNSSPADNYAPKIVIEFDNENRTITILDNGCGMSKDVILNNFLTVGNSRSSNPNYKKGGYSSLARFGIGFWSVFSVVTDTYIETRNFESGERMGLSFSVSIEFLKDFIVFEPKPIENGTTIQLHIKENININEIQSELLFQVICSEIPVQITNKSIKDKTEYFLPREVPIPDIDKIFGNKISIAIANDLKIFNWQEKTENFDLKMFISYRKINGQVSFFLTDESEDIRISNWQNRQISRLFQANSSFKYSSICGFTVNPVYAYTVFSVEGAGGYFANIENPKGYVFNLNRMSLQASPELEHYSQILSTFLLNGYRKFLEFTNSLGSQDIYRLNIESGRGFGSNETNKNHEESALTGINDII